MEGIRLTYSKTIDDETFTAAIETESEYWAIDKYDQLRAIVRTQIEIVENDKEQAAIAQLTKDQEWFCAKPPHTVFEQQNRQVHGMEEYE